MVERNELRSEDDVAVVWQTAAQLVRERIRECRSCSSDYAALARQFDEYADVARRYDHPQARRAAAR